MALLRAALGYNSSFCFLVFCCLGFFSFLAVFSFFAGFSAESPLAASTGAVAGSRRTCLSRKRVSLPCEYSHWWCLVVWHTSTSTSRVHAPGACTVAKGYPALDPLRSVQNINTYRLHTYKSNIYLALLVCLGVNNRCLNLNSAVFPHVGFRALNGRQLCGCLKSNNTLNRVKLWYARFQMCFASSTRGAGRTWGLNFFMLDWRLVLPPAPKPGIR